MCFVKPLVGVVGNRSQVLYWTFTVFLVAKPPSKSKWRKSRSSNNSEEKILWSNMVNFNTASPRSLSSSMYPGVSTGCRHSDRSYRCIPSMSHHIFHLPSLGCLCSPSPLFLYISPSPCNHILYLTDHLVQFFIHLYIDIRITVSPQIGSVILEPTMRLLHLPFFVMLVLT